MTDIVNKTDDEVIAEFGRAIDELRAEVAAMQAEPARRDIEQIEIEGAVEYLERRGHSHHYALGALITNVLGHKTPPMEARNSKITCTRRGAYGSEPRSACDCVAQAPPAVGTVRFSSRDGGTRRSERHQAHQ